MESMATVIKLVGCGEERIKQAILSGMMDASIREDCEEMLVQNAMLKKQIEKLQAVEKLDCKIIADKDKEIAELQSDRLRQYERRLKKDKKSVVLAYLFEYGSLMVFAVVLGVVLGCVMKCFG